MRKETYGKYPNPLSLILKLWSKKKKNLVVFLLFFQSLQFSITSFF